MHDGSDNCVEAGAIATSSKNPDHWVQPNGPLPDARHLPTSTALSPAEANLVAMEGLQTCYRHGDRETGLSCTNCGNYMCPDCSVDAVVGQRCLDCHRSLGTTRVSRGVGDAGLGPVVRGLIVINALVFVAALVPGLAELVEPLIQYNFRVTSGRWWTLLSAAFVHFELWHIGFNMYALYRLGPQLESQLGAGPFLGVYLTSAVTGGIAGYILGGPGFGQVGASGAIYGLAGLLMYAWWPERNQRRGDRGWQFVLLLVGVGIVLPIVFPQWRLSWQGHLGGLIGGLMIAAGWDLFPLDSRRAKILFAIAPGVLILGLVALSVW